MGGNYPGSSSSRPSRSSPRTVVDKYARRYGTRIRNHIYGGQYELEYDGSVVTINPCSDPSYPPDSWYIARQYPDGRKDRTLIVDAEGNMLN